MVWFNSVGNLEENGGMPVNVQDQTTNPIIVKFNKVTNSTTLSADAILLGRTIVVTSATGISTGSYLILFNPASSRYMFTHAVSVTDNTVTIDSELDYAFPSGTYVDVAITNMNIDGSSTSQVFGLRGTGTPTGVSLTIDITRIIFTCICSSAIDLAKFGNLSALTNGLLFRKRNGTYQNIFDIKTNGELAGIDYDFDPYLATNPVQGVDGFVSRLTFAGQEKIGVALRIPIGEDIEFVVQDNLTGLTLLNINAEGHIVQN